MLRRPPRSTRTDTLFPYTTRFRSAATAIRLKEAPAMADGARSDHPPLQTQLDRLAALSPGSDVLGLGRTNRLPARLGNPHEGLPPVFHVPVTNGMGSTCPYLRALL